MAASKMPPAKANPLGFMTKITPYVRLYRPSETSSGTTATEVSDSQQSQPRRPPKLLLICAWMDALEVHVAKYVQKYRELYPTTTILLVMCPLKHTFPTSAANRAVEPAVPIIRAALDSSSSSTPGAQAEPELLIHVFSNGGSSSLDRLYQAWAAASAGDSSKSAGGTTTDPRLPLHVTVYDSAIGEYSYGHTLTVLNMTLAGAGLPPWLRLLLLPLAHLAVALLTLWALVLAPPDPLARIRAAHNDHATAWEARRTYLYSKGDRLVYWPEVERHAADAERKGFRVRRERYDKGEHVALVRADEERYWRVVRETWQGIGSWST